MRERHGLFYHPRIGGAELRVSRCGMTGFLQIAILQAIQANDGKLSWYRLDQDVDYGRGGFRSSPKVSKDLMAMLVELEDADLISRRAQAITRHSHCTRYSRRSEITGKPVARAAAHSDPDFLDG